MAPGVLVADHRPLDRLSVAQHDGVMDEMRSPTDEILEFLRNLEPLVEFEPPASEADIESAERSLGIGLPDELRSFLCDSNGATIGVRLDSGEVIPDASPLVWSLDEIVRNHGPQRPDPDQPAQVLFFANAGVDGILFGHPIRSSSQVGSDVVVWHPIHDELDVAAPSFRAWIEAFLTGTLGL